VAITEVLQHRTGGRHLVQALSSSSNELKFTLNKSLAPWGRALLERLARPPLGNNSRLLWNQKSYYHVHKIPPLVPILRPANLAQVFQFCPFQIHFNNVFLFTTKSYKWSISLSFPPPPKSCKPRHTPLLFHPTRSYVPSNI
jgi:hypothetical protein